MHIYRITNLVNQKVYIGQTVQKNPKMRWYEHCRDARNGKKSYLCDSLRKHGTDNFIWEVIDVATSIQDLNEKEGYWLDFYRSITHVYNVREAGNNKFHSQESIEKMKAAQVAAHARRRENGTEGGWKRIDGGPMKGKKQSKEHSLKISKANTGRQHSKETKLKMSATRKGRSVSDQTREKLREKSLEVWAKRKQLKDTV